jgi:hypothetical protein
MSKQSDMRQHRAGVEKAAELLDSNHPLHGTFVAWCKQQPTKRQARKFLSQYKCYRRAA